MFKRIFQIGFCGDWVEIYKQTPPPKYDGKFILAFREKRKRKVFPLMAGMTMGGAKATIESLTQPPGFKLSVALTQLCLAIGEKMKDPHFIPVTLP